MPSDDDRYVPVSREYRRRFLRIVTEHAFDKLRAFDLVLREFYALLDDPTLRSEVIAEARESAGGTKELVLLVPWHQPLHVVIVVNSERRQERIITVYQPDPALWTADFRRRR